MTALLLGAAAARLAAGALDAPHQELLGARAAGMGGFEAADDESLEALFYNPAALPESGVHLGAFGALDPDPRMQEGLGLSAPVDDGLRLGLFAGGLQDQGINALQSDSLALAAAAQLRLGMSLGLRIRLLQLQAQALAGPVRGSSLDLGWQVRALRAPWMRGYWTLGVEADHLLGLWQDDAWDQALPMALRVGAAYRPWPSLSFGAQGDWTSAPQLAGGSSFAWRNGLQWSAWRSLVLRTGWTYDGRQGGLSVGAGYEPAGADGAGLDWALAYAPDPTGYSQRLELRWAWARQPRVDMQVDAGQLLFDPDSGAVRSARLEVTLSPLLRLKPWHVELKDVQGRVWRSLEPVDAQDSVLVWDGRDDQGRPIPLPPGLRAELVVLSDRGPLRAPAAATLAQASRLEDLSRAGAAQDGALDAPTFKPQFEDPAGGKLSYVDIGLPAARAYAWSLDIQDGRGNSLRRLEGQGDLPRNLVWDGRDAQGHKVEDALSVQMRLQVDDPAGKRSVETLPLFTQQAFVIAHREARQAPEFRLASLGMPLLLGRPSLTWLDGFLGSLVQGARQRQDAESLDQKGQADQDRRGRRQLEMGARWDVDLFAENGSAVLPGRLDLLNTVKQRLLGGGTGQRGALWITGLARVDERDAESLARRRAEATARDLRNHGEDFPIVLNSAVEVGQAKGVRFEFR